MLRRTYEMDTKLLQTWCSLENMSEKCKRSTLVHSQRQEPLIYAKLERLERADDAIKQLKSAKSTDVK
jgi:hypothetical protein